MLLRKTQAFALGLCIGGHWVLRGCSRGARGRFGGGRFSRWGGWLGRFRFGLSGPALRPVVAPTARIYDSAPIPFHGHGRGGDPVEEIPVVADQQHRAVEISKNFLQQIKRFDVEVIRRFVQHQKIGALRHDAGQQQPRLLAARQRAHRRAGLRVTEQEILEVAHNIAGLPPDKHLICLARDAHCGIAGQTFPKRGVGVQLSACLIKHRNVEIGAKAEIPAVRGFLAQQHLQHCCLAHTIGPDKGNAFPPLHAQGKVLYDHLVVKAFGQPPRIDDQLARGRGGLQFQCGRALAAHLCSTIAAQFLQGAHPALIAFAPG